MKYATIKSVACPDLQSGLLSDVELMASDSLPDPSGSDARLSIHGSPSNGEAGQI